MRAGMLVGAGAANGLRHLCQRKKRAKKRKRPFYAKERRAWAGLADEKGSGQEAWVNEYCDNRQSDVGRWRW